MLSLFKRILKLLSLHDKAVDIFINSPAFPVYLTKEGAKKGMKVAIGKDFISYVSGDREMRISKSNLVYGKDGIDHFELYYNAVEPESVNGMLLVDYSKPREHVIKGLNLPFFFTSVAETSETFALYLEKARIKEGDVVFDIGAYCGVSTYLFSKAVGAAGKVIAFEPDIMNFSALRRNMETYTLPNTVLLNKGVWSRPGKVLFQTEGNMGSAVASVTGRASSARAAEMTTLEAVSAEYCLEKVDFIKMDVEGAEMEILRASAGFFLKYRPKMIIESHSDELTRDMVELLGQWRYRTEVLPQGHCLLPLIYAQRD